MSRDSSPQKNLRLETFNIVALAVLSSLRFFSVPVVTQSIFTVMLHFKLIQGGRTYCFTDQAATFFHTVYYPSSLFCRGSVISVSYSRLPQSYDQNKQGTLPCSRVSNKNKEEISLLSFSNFFS